MASATIAAEPLVDGQPADWQTIQRRLEHQSSGQTYWLTTLEPDGRPHVMPLIGLWVDRGFYFLSGPSTRKGRNLGRDGRCAIAATFTETPSVDVVLEGDARRVTDEPTLRRVFDAYRTVLQWPDLELRDGAF